MKTKTLFKTVFLIISIAFFSTSFIACEKNNEFTDDSNIIGKWENIKIETKKGKIETNPQWVYYPDGVIGSWEFTENGEFIEYFYDGIDKRLYTYNNKTKIISFDEIRYPYDIYTVERLTKNELIVIIEGNHKNDPDYTPNYIFQYRFTFKRIK